MRAQFRTERVTMQSEFAHNAFCACLHILCDCIRCVHTMTTLGTITLLMRNDDTHCAMCDHKCVAVSFREQLSRNGHADAHKDGWADAQFVIARNAILYVTHKILDAISFS